MTFEAWFDWFTQCPKCRMSDAVRLTASNAWHSQQHKIDDLQSQNAELIEALESVDTHICNDVCEETYPNCFTTEQENEYRAIARAVLRKIKGEKYARKPIKSS